MGLVGSSISPQRKSPFLVHDQGTDADGSQTQFIISTQTLITRTIDELRDYRYFETPRGWILALEPTSLQTFLWRPQDGERISLPSMQQDLPKNCKCLLSDEPTASSGCVVLVLDIDATDNWACRIGGSEWDYYSYSMTFVDTGKESHIAQGRGIAAVGGKFYHISTGDKLGIVEFNPDMDMIFSDVKVAMVDLPDSKPMCSTYLVESCGELFLVVVFFLGQNLHKIDEVAVYKMDFSKPAWCKVDRIGNRVFLLGGDRFGESNFGASCSASRHGLCGNCIYFVNHIASYENFLHIINLEKGTEEVQRPYKGFPLALRPPFWLLPADQ